MKFLDLRQHLLIPHDLGRLVDCPSSWPAGSGLWGRLLRSDAGTSHVAGQWGSSARVPSGWSNLGAARGVRSGTLGLPGQVAPTGLLPRSASLTQWRQGARGSLRRRDHAQRGHSSPMWRAATGRPVAGSVTMADASLAPLFRRGTRDDRKKPDDHFSSSSSAFASFRSGVLKPSVNQP
jgi:hypothetical protein